MHIWIQDLKRKSCNTDTKSWLEKKKDWTKYWIDESFKCSLFSMICSHSLVCTQLTARTRFLSLLAFGFLIRFYWREALARLQNKQKERKNLPQSLFTYTPMSFLPTQSYFLMWLFLYPWLMFLPWTPSPGYRACQVIVTPLPPLAPINLGN